MKDAQRHSQILRIHQAATLQMQAMCHFLTESGLVKVVLEMEAMGLALVEQWWWWWLVAVGRVAVGWVVVAMGMVGMVGMVEAKDQPTL